MAGVFLSYDRDDSGAARIIATALEKAGHSVWWDLHVRGGAQFSKVIEEALKAADTVVVLWSAQSVDSAWVRDEAAAGRDSGRLIPATIDGTDAPLGFRQFQTIDLTDWKRGGNGRGYRELVHAIEQCSGAAQPNVPPAQAKQRTSYLRLNPWLLGIPVALALLAAAYVLWPSTSSATVPTVTVLPASTASAAQDLSRDLFAKLGKLQSSDSNALQLVEQDSGTIPDLVFKVDGTANEGKWHANLLLLSGRNHALLWSGEYEQPADQEADLKQQLAYSAADVLDCASEAFGPHGRALDDQTRRLYLNGCGAYAQMSGVDVETLLKSFREIARRAPQLEGAWGRLLGAEDETLFAPPTWGRSPELRALFEADIAAARRFYPDIPEAYVGEADLKGPGNLPERLHLIDVAVQRNPASAGALSARSNAFMQVGRMREAVSDAHKALQIRPFSTRAQDAYISALMYAGQLDQAQDELRKAETLWPGATNLEETRFRLNLRYGSPEEALKQINSEVALSAPEQELFLKARIDPSPATIGRAMDADRKNLDGTSLSAAAYAQTLATFGRVDELFDFLINWRRMDEAGFVTVLFRPPFRDFWRQPRSMQVAAHFGVLRYWRETGHWPDFCFSPDLPYDCKKEAAKLSA